MFPRNVSTWRSSTRVSTLPHPWTIREGATAGCLAPTLHGECTTDYDGEGGGGGGGGTHLLCVRMSMWCV